MVQREGLPEVEWKWMNVLACKPVGTGFGRKNGASGFNTTPGAHRFAIQHCL